MKERYLTQNIKDDLESKMVFVGGARQVGKTTLAKEILTISEPNSTYYNWDYAPDRKRIINNELPGEDGLIIFDEIHKYKKWKTTIKGIFDVHKNKYKIAITGSARMNIFRKGGDSLQGRYHYYTLHPFSVPEAELSKSDIEPFDDPIYSSRISTDSFNSLFKFGGFPEMFIKQNETGLRRWHNEKLERLFREDIRDVENIRDISSMKLLGDLLPSKAGSQLSINAIREDLQVSHKAVSDWLDIMERFYYHFRIYPFHSNTIRSLKKESKLYLTDWSELNEESIRFENLIACHLLKFVEYLVNAKGYKAELNYLRNVDKKEVDFLISVDKKPWFAVDAKLTETSISSQIKYFQKRLKIPFIYQVIKKQGVDVLKESVRVISADKFLTNFV
ncbi:MAG: ATP-binding protein [Melioribacteraceae bacterium]|nr:ATP-binding protein [Melioribacteraceae bacterium]MCF8263546.1 ATP-binding protein [Melioribacteraceae bacterium]